MSELDEPLILVNEKGEHDPHIIIITDTISYILIIRVLNMGGGLKECRFFFRSPVFHIASLFPPSACFSSHYLQITLLLNAYNLSYFQRC